ncbi:methyltransferase [Candidatus Woesearchaeota archaeon]|nr:methyltransferase [Candidatus Woesearchaeota archaeon]
MDKRITKSGLAIILSGLSQFEKPSMMSEQYATDSESAAEVLWLAFMNGAIKEKVIADFGCGTGILGIGALILGAERVFFVDNDKNSIELARKNYQQHKERIRGRAEFIAADVSDFREKTDVVVQNPPFGTKMIHADREFLLKAFETADIVYSFHKASTGGFVRSISNDSGFVITLKLEFLLPLKRTLDFHKRRIKRIEVCCFRLEKSH